VILDLFSGSGAASEPWLRDGFPVTRYDILDGWDLGEPLIQKQIIQYHKDDALLLIWASPPCTQYSRLLSDTHKVPYNPDLTLWKAAQHIIAQLAPRYYVIENVGGAVRSWGEPRQRIGSYYLWGNYPLISPPKVPAKGMHIQAPGETNAEKAARAATIPAALAERLMQTILSQSQLPPPEQP